MRTFWIVTLMLSVLACGEKDHDTSDDSMESNTTESTNGKSDDVQQNAEPSSLAEEFDYCGEFDLYDDGECQRFCFEEDPDCEGVEEDAVDVESPFDDCDEDDSSCEDAPSDMMPAVSLDEIQSMCGDFAYAEEIVRDLAITLCREREDDDEAFNACIELCIEASPGVQ